jgi:hypothetical protein
MYAIFPVPFSRAFMYWSKAGVQIATFSETARIISVGGKSRQETFMFPRSAMSFAVDTAFSGWVVQNAVDPLVGLTCYIGIGGTTNAGRQLNKKGVECVQIAPTAITIQLSSGHPVLRYDERTNTIVVPKETGFGTGTGVPYRSLLAALAIHDPLVSETIKSYIEGIYQATFKKKIEEALPKFQSATVTFEDIPTSIEHIHTATSIPKFEDMRSVITGGSVGNYSESVHAAIVMSMAMLISNTGDLDVDMALGSLASLAVPGVALAQGPSINTWDALPPTLVNTFKQRLQRMKGLERLVQFSQVFLRRK